MVIPERMKKVVAYLASTELAVILFLAISLLAIPGTFSTERTVYSSPLFLSLLGLFGLNLALCSVRRYKSVSRPVLILHVGVLLTLFGCILTSFGFVATVNVYEGTSVDRVYRWDQKRDAPLGVGLAVRKINREFYPMPVKIGVLKGKEKAGLYTLKTGESFRLAGYRVRVGELEYPSENITFSVYENDHLIGSASSSGASHLPADFPYGFKLVAFKTPILKRIWVDLMLTRNSRKIAEGISEVNNPFRWGGLYFYNTAVNTDRSGGQYAGIQIVRDPGRPFVFAGFAVVGLGAILSLAGRIFQKKRCA